MYNPNKKKQKMNIPAHMMHYKGKASQGVTIALHPHKNGGIITQVAGSEPEHFIFSDGKLHKVNYPASTSAAPTHPTTSALDTHYQVR